MPTERKVATIPLGVICCADATTAVEEIVRRELARHRRDGWEPEHAVDFDFLRLAGRISEAGPVFGSGPREYVSVDVRLKRSL